ncbi:LysR family transcriptional regulator [Geobacter sp. FeAm09]|uniref:TOBE domain-containing protein n=1 Tax=Geobacter sp. FeAm09 TaxID=2597769 RepID=UPI0011ED5DEF|nr:TOBE domain-containing protein [Geobacter sp. FeAm09]QEM67843.1 LysR family transcriptional regulator [Geobacter sp. FeAm09]
MKTSRNDSKLGLSGAVWLNKEDRKFLGGDRISLLEQIGELGSITKAAKAVGVSYKTAWDLVNMINNLADKPLVDRLTGGKGGGGTTLTAEGKKVLQEFQIIQEEHRKFLDNIAGKLGDANNLYQLLRRIAMKVSARNVFAGTVARIVIGAVNTEVELTLKGGATIAAIVTNGAMDNLDLQVGKDAYAIIKSSSVIVGTDLHDAKLSARNLMCGTVTKIIEGPVSAEVDVEVGGGNTVSAVITHESSRNLGLVVGGHACVIFKASSVILGVS